MLKKTRKAQAHVEMILSFVLFVGFLLVLLFFLNPIGKENLSFSSLDKVQDKLLNNVSINYKSAMFFLNTAPTTNYCVRDFSNPLLIENLIAFDSNGNRVGAELSTNDKKITLDVKTGLTAYKIYSFEGLTEQSTTPPCNSALGVGNYNWGLIENNKAVFKTYLEKLKGDYVDDYQGLKQKLGIEKDFDFVVYDIDRTVFEEIDVRGEFEGVRGNQVLSRDIPLNIIDKTMVETKVILNLRVW